MTGTPQPPLDWACRVRPSAACAYQRIGDQVLVLVPHRRKQHFLKNETAAWIWGRIEAERTLAELRDEMVARYEVPEARAEADLLELCRTLLAEEAIEILGNS